jgi:hypothetical protein
VVVFHDEVLVEEAKGLLIGRGSEADEIGVEVFQHLRPEVVDGPVAFVGDDDVERFDWNRRVVLDRFWLLIELFKPRDGCFLVLFRQFSPLEHGVEPLDGSDTDPSGGIKLVAGEALDDELFGELEVIVGRDVLLKLFESLVAKVAAINQEQHAPGPGEFDEAIDEVDRGEGLSASGGHLNEGAGAVFGQRLFEVGDGGDLRGPETIRDERVRVSQLPEPPTKRREGSIGSCLNAATSSRRLSSVLT